MLSGQGEHGRQEMCVQEVQTTSMWYDITVTSNDKKLSTWMLACKQEGLGKATCTMVFESTNQQHSIRDMLSYVQYLATLTVRPFRGWMHQALIIKQWQTNSNSTLSLRIPSFLVWTPYPSMDLSATSSTSHSSYQQWPGKTLKIQRRALTWQWMCGRTGVPIDALLNQLPWTTGLASSYWKHRRQGHRWIYLIPLWHLHWSSMIHMATMNW